MNLLENEIYSSSSPIWREDFISTAGSDVMTAASPAGSSIAPSPSSAPGPASVGGPGSVGPGSVGPTSVGRGKSYILICMYHSLFLSLSFTFSLPTSLSLSFSFLSPHLSLSLSFISFLFRLSNS